MLLIILFCVVNVMYIYYTLAVYWTTSTTTLYLMTRDKLIFKEILYFLKTQKGSFLLVYNNNYVRLVDSIYAKSGCWWYLHSFFVRIELKKK